MLLPKRELYPKVLLPSQDFRKHPRLVARRGFWDFPGFGGGGLEERLRFGTRHTAVDGDEGFV